MGPLFDWARARGTVNVEWQGRAVGHTRFLLQATLCACLRSSSPRRSIQSGVQEESSRSKWMSRKWGGRRIDAHRNGSCVGERCAKSAAGGSGNSCAAEVDITARSGWAVSEVAYTLGWLERQECGNCGQGLSLKPPNGRQRSKIPACARLGKSASAMAGHDERASKSLFFAAATGFAG